MDLPREPGKEHAGSKRANSSRSRGDFALRLVMTSESPATVSNVAWDQVPNLSLDEEASIGVRASRCAAHVVLMHDQQDHVAVHPAIQSSLEAKLAGRWPLAVFEDDRVEFSFSVENLSAETAAQVATFAETLAAALGTHASRVGYRLLTVPKSEWTEES